MLDTDTGGSLAPRHKLFADKYIETNQKQQSALFAGYSARSAHTEATRLLKRTDIQGYIANTVAKQLTIQVDQGKTIDQRILGEVETLAFANIADLIRIDTNGQPSFDLSTATREQLASIANLKTKTTKRYDGRGQHIATDTEVAISMSDKLRSLELLGKHRGLFRTEEQRVVVDVADRLLNARARLASANVLGAEQ